MKQEPPRLAGLLTAVKRTPGVVVKHAGAYSFQSWRIRRCSEFYCVFSKLLGSVATRQQAWDNHADRAPHRRRQLVLPISTSVPVPASPICHPN
eukprot:1922747-Pleurochrysis_carterae.AAC.1